MTVNESRSTEIISLTKSGEVRNMSPPKKTRNICTAAANAIIMQNGLFRLRFAVSIMRGVRAQKALKSDAKMKSVKNADINAFSLEQNSLRNTGKDRNAVHSATV